MDSLGWRCREGDGTIAGIEKSHKSEGQMEKNNQEVEAARGRMQPNDTRQ